MSAFESIGLEIRNYKSVGSGGIILPNLANFNVIVGRNNTGKSAIIDAAETMVRGKAVDEKFGHKGEMPELLFTRPVDLRSLRQVFNDGVRGGQHIIGNHWHDYGQYVAESRLAYKIVDKRPVFHRVDIKATRDNLPNVGEMWKGVSASNPFGNLDFVRIAADRDIVPEKLSGDLVVLANGSGLTGAVASIFTSSQYPIEWVEDILLADLNIIFGDDERFDGIIVQMHSEGQWEIFLRSSQKGNIPLSSSGSGLKTIIHTIFAIKLLPLIRRRAASSFVYAFEELENNLHPALQRRLISYIESTLSSKDTLCFISTHSNVIIDSICKNPRAVVLHVQRLENSAACRSVKTFVEHRNILDDLDVRASDLLQANGIIWVEGPSDRVYINKLINLWSDGKFLHGIHYQCVLYGGTLLKYFTGSNPEFNVSETIELLRVNKNCAIIMDSDKSSESARISATKKRIKEEFLLMNGFAWITKGREIENYIPPNCIKTIFGTAQNLGQFEDIKEFLASNVSLKASRNFERNKTALAEQVAAILDKTHQKQVLDVDQQMRRLVNFIQKWNGLSISDFTQKIL